ncbi:Uncharacterized protein TCM_045155 [Theobroma cacao]|uniref:Uncharacterized protein n=1 Tax=Theobroma cacao TaxID=3641 RepID=A0A061FSX6_THECC|nr:Uncharacterized protein TCM_045155 [Theobroma cacao]
MPPLCRGLKPKLQVDSFLQLPLVSVRPCHSLSSESYQQVYRQNWHLDSDQGALMIVPRNIGLRLKRLLAELLVISLLTMLVLFTLFLKQSIFHNLSS